ncbi:ImmA/IrrE family metallo-endopeptidase [Streptomyces sp. NPDC057743]|uniref:ImmA/IrrE family metallo-endopeptidase n=1 Tax=Streptomyces sp. NPDC057743 TaxID=3346236 RepID=UPI00369E041F
MVSERNCMHTFDPVAELEKLNIPVQYLPLQDTLAAWDPERCRVYCGLGLHPIQKRCALTHELAHITLEHRRCAYGDDSVVTIASIAQEREAEMWAARKLISVVQFAAAQESGLQPSVIARELGVTDRVYRARFLAERLDETRWLGTELDDSLGLPL